VVINGFKIQAMKTILKTLSCLFATVILLSSCKKTENESTGTFSADAYTYNSATKAFSTNTNVTAQLSSSGGIHSVYAYLVRTNMTDSVISVSAPGDVPEFTLSIPASAFPASSMNKATGIRVLSKQADNSIIEGFIKVSYFNPVLPQLKDFPVQFTANLSGGTTAVTGTLTSEYGLTQVDIYDDYQTANTYVLVNSITNLSNAKTYALNYAYTYRKAAQHIKIVAKDVYGQTNELIVNMPVDVSAFKPKFAGFAAKIKPNLSGTTAVTGTITSVTGLKRIEVYDDYKGAYVLVATLNNLNSTLSYSFNYNYTFRKRATNLKIIATDLDDLPSEQILPLDITYSSTVYRDVVMNAHTTGTNTIFFIESGSTLGNCDLTASESTMAFLFYGTTTGPAFYSPTNTGSVAGNFKCGSVGWASPNASSLRATRFRVLVPGSTGNDNVYALNAANNIDVLDDAFFATNSIAAPGSSSAKFDAAATPTTSIFNLTTANLIYIRIPDVTGPGYKNALMVVKEATSAGGASTVKFDIYIQK
jgi:hypothetical protein